VSEWLALSVPDTTLSVMDDLSHPAFAEPEPSLTESGQAALRNEALRRLGTLPFPPGARFSRSLWLMFLSPRGIQSRATLPVDNRFDLPEQENIEGLCDLLASLMEHSADAERAVVALRRPGTAEISQADKYIFRVLSEAAASRETVPWTFHVTAPDNVRQVTRISPHRHLVLR
jgi:hypothetical protein